MGMLLATPAGCGGGGSEAGPEATVEAFIGALRDGDADAACAELDARTLDDLEASGSCEEVLGKGFRLFADEGVEIPDYEIGDVTVDGDEADVTLSSEATEDDVHLLREDGSWKLDGATALAGLHPDSPLDVGGGVGDDAG
jgi:hypothetical protein